MPLSSHSCNLILLHISQAASIWTIWAVSSTSFRTWTCHCSLHHPMHPMTPVRIKTGPLVALLSNNLWICKLLSFQPAEICWTFQSIDPLTISGRKFLRWIWSRRKGVRSSDAVRCKLWLLVENIPQTEFDSKRRWLNEAGDKSQSTESTKTFH